MTSGKYKIYKIEYNLFYRGKAILTLISLLLIYNIHNADR